MPTFLSPWGHPTTATNSALASMLVVKWDRGIGERSSDGNGLMEPKALH